MNYNQNPNIAISLNSNNNYPNPISNQSTPGPEELQGTIDSLRSTPVFSSCPGCRVTGPSKVIRNLSCPNLIFCILLSPCWFGNQSYKIKDLNCFDADHYCNKCGNLIGKYSAC